MMMKGKTSNNSVIATENKN